MVKQMYTKNMKYIQSIQHIYTTYQRLPWIGHLIIKVAMDWPRKNTYKNLRKIYQKKQAVAAQASGPARAGQPPPTIFYMCLICCI